MNLDPKLLREARYAWTVLLLCFSAGFAAGLCVVLQAQKISRIVTGAFFEAKSLSALLPALWVLLAAVVLRAGFTMVSDMAGQSAARRVKDHLRGLLAEKVVSLGPSSTHDERSGALMHTLVQGIDGVDGYFSQYLPQLVLAGLLPVAYLLMVLRVDPLSALVLALTGPLIPLFMFLIGSTGERLTRRQFGALRQMSAYFLDTLQGLATLKALGRSRDQHRRIADISERYREMTMQVLRLTFLSALALELLSTLGTAIIAVQAGLRLLYGQMNFEQAFFLLLLAPDFYLPLRALGLRFHASMNGVSAARQIFATLDLPLHDLPQGNRDVNLRAPFTISLRSVTYRYARRDEPALDGVSLDIPSGQTVALVGATGAGKSTLAALLLRFLQPQAGELFWNDQRLDTLDLEKWRGQIAWVPQRPHLFHGTLAENLRVALPAATEGDMRAALIAARLDEFVDRLPGGLNAPIGEGGMRLSAGQAQRLALARAFLRNAPLVVMDEPTAHMDVEGEAALLESCRQLLRGRTALVIAHRLSTALSADRVIVLENGRIREDGLPRALAATGGVFAQLFARSKPDAS